MLKGKVFKFGDDIDTDIIVPATYLSTFDPAELAKHCMEYTSPDFYRSVKPGDIIVAGKNFGCGSSREHAPIAIKGCGVSIVIAKSFAQYRTLHTRMPRSRRRDIRGRRSAGGRGYRRDNRRNDGRKFQGGALPQIHTEHNRMRRTGQCDQSRQILR